MAIEIECPHCRAAIDLPDAASQEVVCSECGSSFQFAQATTAWEPSDGCRKFGKFDLIFPVGVGAFGTVYKARDPELDRVIALKVPRAGHVPQSGDLERFLREARSAAQLQHPGIVPIHEVGQVANVPYIVSDFVDGVTLADHLSARQPAPAEAARLVARVAEALQYAARSRSHPSRC